MDEEELALPGPEGGAEPGSTVTLLVEEAVRMFFCHLGGMLLWSALVTGRIRTATWTDVVLAADGVMVPLASRVLDMAELPSDGQSGRRGVSS